MPFHIARVFLGLLFFVFGLNGFFHFRPLPQMKEPMMKFNEALQATKIIMPVVKIFEIVFGLALLLNVFPLLAALMLAPICFFIVVSHLTFNRPQGIPMAALVAISILILLKDQLVPLSILLQP